MKFLKIKISRTTACVLAVVIFFSIFELQLFRWQVIDGTKFEAEAMSHRTDAVEIDAARGEILDKDGNVLVGNRVTYQVVYNALYMQGQTLRQSFRRPSPESVRHKIHRVGNFAAQSDNCPY